MTRWLPLSPSDPEHIGFSIVQQAQSLISFEGQFDEDDHLTCEVKSLAPSVDETDGTMLLQSGM